MANEVKIGVLADALTDIGAISGFKGSFLAANSMLLMGQRNGAISVDHTQTWKQIRAENLTGGAVHDERLVGEDLVVTIPLLVDPLGAFWAANSPVARRGWGSSYPQKPVDTSVALIPDYEIGGGLKYDGTTWSRLEGNGVAAATGAGATPKNALWIPRARLSWTAPSFDDSPTAQALTVTVTIQAKWSNQAGVPEHYKLYFWGDPVTIPVTGFLFSAPT